VGTHRAFLSKEEVELLRQVPGSSLPLVETAIARRVG